MMHTWPANWRQVQAQAVAHNCYIAVSAHTYQYELRQRGTAPPVVLAGPFVAWADCCAALAQLINPLQLPLFAYKEDEHL